MILQPAAEGRFDRGAGVRHGEWRHAILESCEITGEFWADDVGARREELAELDVARPEPAQRAADAGVSALAAPERRRDDAHRPCQRARKAQRPRHRDSLRHEPDAVLRQDQPGAREAHEVDEGAGHEAGHSICLRGTSARGEAAARTFAVFREGVKGNARARLRRVNPCRG
jgi:hypothetical protein